MARLNLLDPANEAKSSSGSKFKEGNIRVSESVFTVHKPGNAESKTSPVTALAWTVERLDEDLQPLTDDESNPLIEKLYFGLGGKSLPKVHPAKGDDPEDEQPEDLGDEISTEGNTLALVDETFRIHEKSSSMVLIKSLTKAGWKDEYNRMWAPDYKGLVCFMGTFADETMKMMNERTKQEEAISYKVVTRIHSAPYEAKKKAAAKTESKAAGKGGAAEAAPSDKPEVLKAIELLKKLVAEKDGKTLTMKAIMQTVSNYITAAKIDTKLQVPILTLFKLDKWLNKHAEELGYVPDTDDDQKIISIAFGNQETEE